jgi:PhnB protein
MKPTLSPYVMFSGQCAEAMKFYQSVLGGELNMQTYSQSGQSQKEEEKDLIMHAELKNDALTFMASDGNAEHPVTAGDNIRLSISGTDEATLTKYFNGLAEGGSIDLPLAKQFWGDTFGMLTDKFGIHWMINISSGEPQQKPQ